MQASDSFLRSSVEDQIEEARRRAYSYAHSLKGVREQDAFRAKSLEEERDRWARTFEEKSVLIEQLERELNSAVDALELQRLQNQRSGNTTLILDEDKINSDFKRLLHSQSPTRSPSRRVPVDVSRLSMTNRSNLTEYNTGNRLYSAPIYTELFNNSQSHASVNVSGQSQSNVDVWNHLLEQYKEQLQRSREDVSNLTQEKKDLLQRLLEVTKEMTLIADERDQMKTAMEDMEGRLQFRSTQVISIVNRPHIFQSTVLYILILFLIGA